MRVHFSREEPPWSKSTGRCESSYLCCGGKKPQNRIFLLPQTTTDGLCLCGRREDESLTREETHFFLMKIVNN